MAESLPTASPELTSKLTLIAANIASSAEEIKNKLIEGVSKECFTNDYKPYITIDNIKQYIDRLVIPQFHFWEGSWGNHPSDPEGASMKGILLPYFISAFDDIFVKTDIAAVKTQVEELNKVNWKKQPATAKEYLYILLSNKTIASLYIYHLLCNKDARYPFAIMTIDPYLGFLYAAAVFVSGTGAYQKQKLDNAAKAWVKATDDTLKSPVAWYQVHHRKNLYAVPTPSMGTVNTVQFGAFKGRLDYVIDTTKAGSGNESFKDSWMDRLHVNNKSDLAMLVVTNEIFNKNAKGSFSFTDDEKKYLAVLAAAYETFKIAID